MAVDSDSWLQRVKTNILPLSEEDENVSAALSEWYYTGEVEDLGCPCECCQLCNHPDIRYQFTIENRYNVNRLLVGSECVKRMDIDVIHDDGEIAESDDLAKKVDTDKRNLLKTVQTRHVINTLLRLGAADDEFNFEQFRDYYEKRGAFTPNQLSYIVWRLRKANISYSPAHFKLIIRRDREKAQLAKMERWKLRQIWKCLSPSQQKWAAEHCTVAARK